MESLDEIFTEELDEGYVQDAVESKLFGLALKLIQSVPMNFIWVTG